MFNKEIYDANMCKFKKLLNLHEKRFRGLYATPLIFSILVTNQCNLRCKHCFYHKTIENGAGNEISKKQLSIDEYEKISSSMGWFLTGIFCGGEPFIRSDFSEIIAIFQKNNKIVTADSASNGVMTDQIINQTEAIVSKNKEQVFTLGISIDGFREQHDEIRGGGTFDSLLVTWRELKKLEKFYNNFQPYICTTINTINESTLESFINWSMRELKPVKISFIKTRQNPRDGDYLKNIDYGNYLSCVKCILGYIKEGKMGDVNKPQTYLLSTGYMYNLETMETNEKRFHCYAGKHGSFIDFNGNLGFCEVLESIGNLRDYDYDVIKLWNSAHAIEQRRVINECNDCKACTHESEGLIPSILFHPNNIIHDIDLH